MTVGTGRQRDPDRRVQKRSRLRRCSMTQRDPFRGALASQTARYHGPWAPQVSPLGALRRTTCCKVSRCGTCQRGFHGPRSRPCSAPMAQAARGMRVHEPDITRLRKPGRHRARTCVPLPAGRRPRERQHVLQVRRRQGCCDCSADGMCHHLCARRKEGMGTQHAGNAASCTRRRTIIAGPAAD
jgi:hypothetical protein